MPAILGIFGFIFKDWRMILALILLVIAGVLFWKFKSLDSDLVKSKEALRIEQVNTQTLRNNLASAAQINQENANVIKQLEEDKKRALEAIAGLNTDIKKTNQGIEAIKQKINSITTPPTKLTPYLVEAVRGVQDMRDAENPPTPITQPPKDKVDKKVVTITRPPQ